MSLDEVFIFDVIQLETRKLMSPDEVIFFPIANLKNINTCILLQMCAKLLKPFFFFSKKKIFFFSKKKKK